MFMGRSGRPYQADRVSPTRASSIRGPGPGARALPSLVHSRSMPTAAGTHAPPLPALALPLEKPASRWLFSIDLCRGVAATAVFLHHADGMTWRRHPMEMFEGHAAEFFRARSLPDILSYVLFGFGFLGVPLFFVISGFCIHLPLAGNERPLDRRAFAIRRFFRLYPLYLVVVLTVFALMRLKHAGADGGVTAANLVGHLVFWLFNTPPSDPGMGISPVLWSIAVEVQFYILYALLLPLLRLIGFRRSALLFLGIDLGYRIAFDALGGRDAGIPRPFTPMLFAPARFGEWLLGAWIAESYVRGALTQSVRAVPFRIVTGLIILVASIPVVAITGVPRFWLDIPAGIAFALVLSAILAREQRRGPPTPNLFTRAATWLGDRSYSLYLVHFTVINVVIEAAARLMHTPDKDAIAGRPPMFLAIALAAIAVLITTDLAYRLIEAPSHRLARRLSRRGESASAVGPQSHDVPS